MRTRTTVAVHPAFSTPLANPKLLAGRLHAEGTYVRRKVHHAPVYTFCVGAQELFSTPCVERRTRAHFVLNPYNSGMSVRATPELKKAAGDLIRAARKARGWTLGKLAEELGYIVKPSALGNYEQGTRLAPQAVAIALERVLGIPAAKLLQVEGLDMELTRREIMLIEAFRLLPAADREAYLARIQKLATIYGEPVPDERLPTLAPPKLLPKPRKGTKKR